MNKRTSLPRSGFESDLFFDVPGDEYDPDSHESKQCPPRTVERIVAS